MLNIHLLFSKVTIIAVYFIIQQFVHTLLSIFGKVRDLIVVISYPHLVQKNQAELLKYMILLSIPNPAGMSSVASTGF